ncbi:hypothetical protein ACHMWN_13220 [Pedobacter sp. UC225_61]
MPIKLPFTMRIILVFFLFFTFPAFSQQLNKSETIKYLNTRLSETKELEIYYNADRKYTISNTSFYESSKYKNKVVLSYTRNFLDGFVDQLEYIFDPLHISSLGTPPTTYNEAVGKMPITLIGQTLIVKQTTNGKIKYSDQNTVYFPFLRSEKLNTERVQKAFLHLKKLYQDTKPLDPFLN